MKTSEILAKAADLIEQRGWNQGWYVNDCGGLCATGAMFAAVGMEPVAESQLGAGSGSAWGEFAESRYDDATRAWDRFAAYLGVQHAPSWNDEHERTKEEVVAKLREAARAER